MCDFSVFPQEKKILAVVTGASREIEYEVAMELAGRGYDLVAASYWRVPDARRGKDASVRGEDHVYAASPRTRIEGKMANAIPGEMKAAIYENMVRPLDEK